MTTELVVQIITFVATFALIGGLVWWSHTSGRRRLLRMAEVLDERGGEIGGFPFLVLEGHYQRRPVTLRLNPGGGSNNPRLLHVVLGEKGPLGFRIQKEGMVNFLAVHIGLMKDIELGDENLDRDFVFSSSDPERFASWFLGGEVRDTVVMLMKKHGVDELAQDQELRAELLRFSGREAKPENLRVILDGLRVLRRTQDRA